MKKPVIGILPLIDTEKESYWMLLLAQDSTNAHVGSIALHFEQFRKIWQFQNGSSSYLLLQ